MASDGGIVVVAGVRVRRDEAAALGITIPDEAAAPAPQRARDGDEPKKKSRAAANKSRTPANK